MSEKYYTVTAKVSEDDLKEYLRNYYDEEEIEASNLQDEATQIVRDVLSNEFSVFNINWRVTTKISEVEE